ncbi:hypothetical protein Tco_0039430 [Tanacetum coccineum]
MEDKGDNQGGRCHPVSWKVSWGYMLLKEEAVEENGRVEVKFGKRLEYLCYQTATLFCPQLVKAVVYPLPDRHSGDANVRLIANGENGMVGNNGSRGREAAIGMSLNDFKALLVEEFCPELNKMERKLGECVLENTYDEDESSKQGSTWKDNKKSKTGSGFMVTVPPKNNNVNTYPNVRNDLGGGSCDAVRMGQMRKESRRACYECEMNIRNNGNQERGKAFNGMEVEALQDPKVVKGNVNILSLRYAIWVDNATSSFMELNEPGLWNTAI